MKIELAKVPVKLGDDKVEQRDYIMIHAEGHTLSLPLDPDYDTEEYKKVFEGFFTKISEVVVEEPKEEAKENNG